MKKVLLTLSILFIFAIGANAQVPSPFSFYAGGAISVPAGDGFDAAYKTGWHGMVGAGYKMAPAFQLIGKAEYHSFAFQFGDELGLDGGNWKVMMFGADGRLNLNMPAAPVAPFIFGGVGLANVKISDFEGPVLLTSALNDAIPDSQNKVYFNAGAGFELKAGPSVSLFAQGRYVNIGTDGGSTSFIPITVGLRFF